MRSNDLRYVPAARGHPIVHILVSFPIAFFSGALVTDIVYARTAAMLWADFSAWLLAAGFVLGVLAALAGLVDLAVRRHSRAWGRILLVGIGSLVVLGVAFVNNLVHSRDAWTSVVPLGLALSAVTVVVMLVTAWFGFSGTYARVPVAADVPYGAVRS